ncbi:N-6 DNA methylase [Halochromatium glycolicum]|uniref:site-specific DNA-methyltransferase (adenine-specific) n=1 Tax=Halochromatium glycolicum TaxID=85075 RepID=A0AAJ0XAV5_9GAMM|nr:N-6 DNA methylase [Halochromatium glycolicum]MBK1705247.1 restriction endonuclease subunit M [Halochromatium glycolicum]
MDPLAKPLRRQLEEAVVDARDTAEEAARAALMHLGVGDADAPKHLTDAERALRRRLRAHGRQLGDQRRPDAHQAIDKLVQETAYEHWHRMLFARFLAENGLLMHPDGVALTLDECNELARDEGAADGWELAGRYASRMLPQIFRPDSPVLALKLAPEHQRALEHRLAGLHPDTFQAADSLGWVYQFWQTKRKDAVNRSEVKIGADELPAVTQLFTEPYMVAFLLDNSLGAWWAARRLNADDLRSAESEEALRRKAAIPGVPLEYLRFVKEEDDAWTPAAGTFDAWPEHLGELKVMDPCCGSGHFLVAALQMLVPMRKALEGLDARTAVDAVLRDNLHGLELDQRCVEIAAFALALTAWRWPDAGGYRPLPALNLACSGLGIHAPKADWLRLAEGDVDLEHALERLYDLFKDAPTLGSLIDPRRALGDDLLQLSWVRVEPLLERALGSEDAQQQELGVLAAGLAQAARLLADRYHCVVTNVPYLTRQRQSKKLMDYFDGRFAKSKNELGYVFLSRFLDQLPERCPVAAVMPQNVLYMARYKSFRVCLLESATWELVARLGTGAFEAISGEVVNVGLFIMTASTPISEQMITCIDVPRDSDAHEKARHLSDGSATILKQNAMCLNPDSVFGSTSVIEKGALLAEHAECYQGLRTGDANRFVANWWEIPFGSGEWDFFQTSSTDDAGSISGYTGAIFWQGGAGQLHEYAAATRYRLHDMHESGNRAWGRCGIAVGQMTLRATVYLGAKFDNPVAVVVPKETRDLDAIWAFLSSEQYRESVKEVNRGLYITNAALLKVSFDRDYWVDAVRANEGLSFPRTFSPDPFQWIFHGHPYRSRHPLHVAVGRLIGFRWPAEKDCVMALSDESRALVAETRKLDPFSDDDGICCLPAIRGEPAAHERLLGLLEAAYGDDWTAGTLGKLLAESGAQGKGLDVWLRDAFFQQHCKLFHHRPFIWHIWDGLKDGFAALVNYHRLDRANLERLIYTYLGDWIRMQERAAADGQQGADERLAAAKALKTKLEAILEGEAPLDIFVRWKPVEQQPIGWEPDLNDGVRLNIRPFMLAGDVGKKGAGVLRAKPNIHWKKDRGKDVESAPWYPVFQGERINDHHLTLAEKRAARGGA